MRKSYLLICALMSINCAVVAQQMQQRDTLLENRIEAQLAEKHADMVKVFHAATLAMDSNNFVRADSLYGVVLKADAMFDPAIRRRGMVRFQMGKQSEGIALCELAITYNRSAYNLYSAALCYSSSDSTQPDFMANQEKAIRYLNEGMLMEGGEGIEFPYLLGSVALRINSKTDFSNATAILMKRFPGEMITHYFAAILAVMNEDWELAESEVSKAQALGLDNEDAQKIRNAFVKHPTSKTSFLEMVFYAFVLWVLGLIVLYILGRVLSLQTLRFLEKSIGLQESHKRGRILRSVYKAVINFSAVYYYLSQPFILILLVFCTGGIIFLFLAVGVIPIYISILLIIGCCISIYSMLRSLFMRVEKIEPGKLLTTEEAPGLYALVNEVAQTINTRPLDEIRLTPGIDLSVYERGSWLSKTNNNSKRIMLLGAGIVKDFRKDEFCAVLAHEYGHFTNRDTAGGAVAMSVKRNIGNYYQSLYKGGQAVWWNVAFQFLRLYHLIFRRISYGSERLQEVMADQLAAKTYGSGQFKDGLTFVIRRMIAFPAIAQKEINTAMEERRKLINLYTLPLITDSEIEEAFQKRMNEKTSKDDTHPSPGDRFRYVDRLSNVSALRDATSIETLFLSWDQLSVEMTNVVERSVNPQVN